MSSDSVSNFLTGIKNGYLARHRTVELSYAKILLEIGKILKKEGLIEDTELVSQKGKKTIVVTLAYPKRKPALTDVKRVSKPGLRVYVPKKHIPMIYGGLGLVIMSTSKGIMTGKEAAHKNLGGEVLCKIW